MGNSLFGTDGIRGTAGRYPLDAATIRQLATIMAMRIRQAGSRLPFLLVRDTRLSGVWIRDLVRAEFENLGQPVTDGGIMPTPAAAYLLARGGYAGGLVISASHNPAADNGLKLLTSRGTKLTGEEEEEIETALPERQALTPAEEQDGFGSVTFREETDSRLLDQYVTAVAAVDGVLAPGSGRILFDCAQGAACAAVRQLAIRTGLPVEAHWCTPDGLNINRDCGATAPGFLQELVVKTGARIGFCLDGDADRVLAVAPDGRLLDGDALLFILARDLQAAGYLTGQTVVGTVLTNLGLEKALRRSGIQLLRMPVGDRPIQARMLADGFVLGGEPSGHIIHGRRTFTGDGLMVAFELLGILARTGRSLDQLLAGYQPYESKMVNFRVRQRIPVEDITPLRELEQAVNRQTEGEARLIVRYSGTEPLLRVMLEAPDLATHWPVFHPYLLAVEKWLST